MKNNNPKSKPPEEKNALTLPRLVWPMMVETLLFMMLGMVDVFVMSRYDDLAASSVNTANQAISVITIVFTVISGAGGILITQYLGAGKRQDASRAAALSIVLQLVAGIVVSLVLLVFSTPILSFIGAQGDILEFSRQYLTVVGGSMFFQAVMGSMTVIMRSHGNTKLPMLVTVGINIINTALDVVLVPGLLGFPKMGIYGVAVATVLSRVLGCIVIGILLFKRIESISCFKLLKPFPKKDIVSFFKVGIPAALETFLYNLSQLVITSIVLNCLTENELIAKTYIQMITVVFYIFSVSIGQASQIIIGHLVGADRTEEAYRQGLRSHKAALAIAISASVFGVLLRVPLISIFTTDPEVTGIASVVLVINLLLEFGRTTNLVLIACLRGAGDVFYPTACAIVSNWLISVLGTYLLAVTFGLGIYGLWIALALDECVRGVLMIFRWRGGKWRTKKLAGV